VEGVVSVDNEALLVTDFVNLKIKPAQSFRGAHRGRMYVRVFIGVSAHTCMSICVCIVFLKKKLKYRLLESLFVLEVDACVKRVGPLCGKRHNFLPINMYSCSLI
jgi:hypothetical protein